MAENQHASDGLAEDLIRSFVQIASAELHSKTLLEKRVSELENGLIDLEKPNVLEQQLQKITENKETLNALANLRRREMLYLYELYGSKGDKEQWCLVKHLGLAMYTAFEAWQASSNDEKLLNLALEINQQFIQAVSRFLGVEVTACAACFADILKGGELDDYTVNVSRK